MSDGLLVIRLLASAVWRDLKTLTRYKVNFAFEILSGVLWGLALLLLVPLYASSGIGAVTGTTNYISFLLLGVSFQAYQGVALWGAAGRLREELNLGTVEYILSNPVPRQWYLISTTLAMAVTDTLGFLPMFLVAVFFVGPSLTAPGLALALGSALLAAAALAQLGVLFATLVLKFKNVTAIFGFFNLGFQMMTGMFVPLQVLPQPLAAASVLFPMTFGIDLMRHYLLGSILVFPEELEWLGLAIQLVALGLLAKVALTYVERSAKQEGLHYV